MALYRRRGVFFVFNKNTKEYSGKKLASSKYTIGRPPEGKYPSDKYIVKAFGDAEAWWMHCKDDFDEF